MRKRGKPNPSQRYFALVVTLYAQCDGSNSVGSEAGGEGGCGLGSPRAVAGERFAIASQISEKLIVRASCPSHFDIDIEREPPQPLLWSTGAAPNSIFTASKVAVNTTTATEALSVGGNVRVTGKVLQPSDRRVKTNIQPADTVMMLSNVSEMGLYSYDHTDEWCATAGLDISTAAVPELAGAVKRGGDGDGTGTCNSAACGVTDLTEAAGAPAGAATSLKSNGDAHLRSPLRRSQCCGVIAQELQQILPDAVVKDVGDTLLINGTKISHLLTVDKDRIHMEALGAIQELAKQVAQLQATVAQMQQELAASRQR
jgi:hypothetical protein